MIEKEIIEIIIEKEKETGIIEIEIEIEDHRYQMMHIDIDNNNSSNNPNLCIKYLHLLDINNNIHNNNIQVNIHPIQANIPKYHLHTHIHLHYLEYIPINNILINNIPLSIIHLMECTLLRCMDRCQWCREIEINHHTLVVDIMNLDIRTQIRLEIRRSNRRDTVIQERGGNRLNNEDTTNQRIGKFHNQEMIQKMKMMIMQDIAH